MVKPVIREGYIPVANTGLYFRLVGQGKVIIILHGGPDFDHNYLLPEMDRLTDSYCLIYYDQRGRGRSATSGRSEAIGMTSEVDDLDAVRAFFGLESVVLLGHSWGGLLAMEYALRHPTRVSHLILMNSAPASRADFLLFREERQRSAAGDLEQLATLRATPAYQAGNLEADAAYHRIHFRGTVWRPEQLEQIVNRLRANFTTEGILKARAIEDRLMAETWLVDRYDLLPRLKQSNIPTLVLHGQHDFIPAACSEHIAAAIPDVRYVLMPDVGHFSYMESPDAVREEINQFFATL